MDQAFLYAFMTQHRLAVISSVSAEGDSQSALIGIATTPKLEILFDTLTSSRKYGNLMTRPACSLVMGWTGEQTLQYEGWATRLEEPELGRYQQTYFGVWPEARAHETWPGIAYFVIRPRWIRFGDWEVKPALIREISGTELANLSSAGIA